MNEDFSIELHYMRLALKEAQMAAERGEVPVGATIVHEQRIVGRAHNQVELLKDPTAHAEMIAITQAANALGDWRLSGCTLYVTKEPCPMCAGAIVNARLDRIVWGMTDPLRGGGTSLFNILENPSLNHRPEITEGVLEDECKALMQAFFRTRRANASGKHGEDLAGGDSKTIQYPGTK